MKTNITIIGASAGTGKTYKLTEEVFKAISTDEARPEALMVTTFTRKAAAELLGRVTAKLTSEGKRDAAQAVRQSLIGTVNSVCGRLLEEYAFECGLGFHQAILDENQEEEFFNKALAGILDAPEEKKRLAGLSRQLSIDDWRKLVAEVARKARLNMIPVEDLPKRGRQSADLLFDGWKTKKDNAAQLMSEVEKAAAAMGKLIAAEKDKTKKTQGVYDYLQAFLRDSKDTTALPWVRYTELAGLEAGLKSGADDLLVKIRTMAQDHCCWPAFKESLCESIQIIFTMAAKTLTAYQDMKFKGGFLDFVDQENLCLKALENPAVCASLKERLNMVFVDEFQDTSPIQLALFLKLTGLAKKSIWVGDPKQSIFAFRDTDPELMVRALDEIACDPETLEISYRSRPELIAFTNSVFKDAFWQQNIGPKHVTIEAKRKKDLDSIALESWVLSGKMVDNKLRMNQAADFQALAGQIKKVLDQPKAYPVLDKRTGKIRPIRKDDIAILARTNSNCEAIALALIEFNIPVELGVAGLLQEQAIQLVIAGLRIVRDPDDTLAAANLVFLHKALSQKEYQDEWLGTRLEEVHQQKGEGAWLEYPLIQALRAAAKDLQDAPPSRVLAQVMDIVQVWEFFKHTENPRRTLANVEQMAQYVSEYESAGLEMGSAVTLTGLIDHLDALAEDKGDTIALLGSNAVRVLTYHKAKGLEWPMVILYDLNKVFNTDVFAVRTFAPKAMDLDQPLKDRGVLCWPSPYGWGGESPFVEFLKTTDIYKKAVDIQFNESIRVLYVAFTRARDYLVFAAREGDLNALAALTDKDGQLTCDIPQDTKKVPKGWAVRAIMAEDPDEKALVADINRAWFKYTMAPTPKKPMQQNASTLDQTVGAAGKVTIGEPLQVGAQLELGDTLDMEIVGTTLHAFLGIDTTLMAKADKEALAQRIIAQMGMETALKASNVVVWADAFTAFVNQRWPKAVWCKEWPIRLKVKDQEVHGFIDILLETATGMVILDYKTYTGTIAENLAEAKNFAGQLMVYGEAVGLDTGKKIEGAYVVFPVNGIVVEIKR
jgi:ATP-dependent exoDNAse (exonuclease V) beta subunit